jgi:transketolase
VRQGWDALIGADGVFVGMSGFGASAPYEELYRHFGITAARVAAEVERHFGEVGATSGARGSYEASVRRRG